MGVRRLYSRLEFPWNLRIRGPACRVPIMPSRRNRLFQSPDEDWLAKKQEINSNKPESLELRD